MTMAPAVRFRGSTHLQMACVCAGIKAGRQQTKEQQTKAQHGTARLSEFTVPAAPVLNYNTLCEVDTDCADVLLVAPVLSAATPVQPSYSTQNKDTHTPPHGQGDPLCTLQICWSVRFRDIYPNKPTRVFVSVYVRPVRACFHFVFQHTHLHLPGPYLW
jgi:hypothetical protein